MELAWYVAAGFMAAGFIATRFMPAGKQEGVE